MDWPFVSCTQNKTYIDPIRLLAANIDRQPCNSIISSKTGKYLVHINAAIHSATEDIVIPTFRTYGISKYFLIIMENSIELFVLNIF